MHLDPWKILLVAALVFFSVFIYRRTFPPVSRVRRALLATLRIGAFALLGLLLLNPVFVSIKTGTKKPLVLVFLDHSRSMGLRDAGGSTRLDAALAAVNPFRGSLARDARSEVEVIPFSDVLSSAPLRPDSALKADGEGTDIWGAIAAGQRKYRSSNLAAIVLLTDGRVTRGMVTSGGGITVPVYTIGFGDTLEGADVAVDEVICDRIAYKGTKVPVEAVIRASGFKGKALQVRLLESGKVKDGVSLAVKKDSEVISASLSYVPEKEGEHKLTVEVAPLAGERQSENNLESFRIDVLKDKIRILFIDQFPDWNMTFVRDLVRRSRRLEVEAVSWKPEKGFTSDPGGESWVFPSSAAGLAAYDLVIVSDDAKLFNARQNAEILGSYLEDGGSVLFLADENSPLARAGSFELLQSLLPVRGVGTPRVEYRESFVKLSIDAGDDPVASMLAEDGGLETMPPLPGRIADVAATSAARTPLILEAGRSGYPFLAVGRRGRGLTSVILGFPLWRWKLAGDEGRRIYESFLGGLVQYLAEGAKTPGLVLDADRTVYRTGDRISLTVFIGERRLPEAVKGEVRKLGSVDDLPVSTIVFEPDAGRKGYYRAELEPLSAGEYVVTASEVTSSGGGSTGAASFTVLPVSVEFLRTARDGALLAEIAEATGGSYLEASKLPGLASRLNLREQKVERRDVHEMRGNILILIGIVIFLAVEWILRKAWGLV